MRLKLRPLRWFQLVWDASLSNPSIDCQSARGEQTVRQSVLQSVSQLTEAQTVGQTIQSNYRALRCWQLSQGISLPTFLPSISLSVSICLSVRPSVRLSLCHSGICNNIVWALEPNCLRSVDPFAFLSGWSSNQAHFCSFTFPFWQIHWPYIYTHNILVSAVSVCSPWQFEAWVWTQHFEIISGA